MSILRATKMFMIKNNMMFPATSDITRREYIYLKWKYTKDIQYEQCPEKKQTAQDNLRYLVGMDMCDEFKT